MSIFNYLFDNEWRQRSDIEDLRERSRRQQYVARREKRRASSEIQALEYNVKELQEQVGELQLITRAMHQMLQSQNGWDESRFQKILVELDLEDGVRDGKVTSHQEEEPEFKPSDFDFEK